jgi:hypothetical protein
VRVTRGACPLPWRPLVSVIGDLATYCICVTQADVGHAGKGGNLYISIRTVELAGAVAESRGKDFPGLYRTARGTAAANADGEISNGP